MKLEEAKEILINVMADEVVGTYCNVIQKTVECSKNCENEDCFLQQAIDTVIAELHTMQNLLDEKNEELARLQKENEELKEKIIEVEKENQVQKAVIYEYSISKDKVKDCLDDIEDYFENVSVPYEDIEFIKEKRKDLLKEE